jgi:protocatechuate 3,4-dioxygenase beta subunit
MKIILAALLLTASAAIASGPPPTPMPPANVSSVGVIAGPSEAGVRMVIDGQLFAPDGVTPVPGVIVYAWQTDNTGEYRNDASRVARLHGWARTDAHGHFEFRTIRPAPYPGRGIAAHVHFHVWGGGYPLQWTDELQFADDPLVKASDRAASRSRGKFGNVSAVTRDPGGTQHATINFRIRSETNYPPEERGDPRTTKPAFLTGLRREAAESGLDARRTAVSRRRHS